MYCTHTGASCRLLHIMAAGRSVFSGDVDHHALIGTDENLVGFLRWERELEEAERKKEEAQRKLLEEIQFETLADDVMIEYERMKDWTESEARAYFESGGTDIPSREAKRRASSNPPPPPSKVASVAMPPPPPVPAPVQQYQMDMFGVKRGRCLKDASCARFTPRVGLQKTEGLGSIGVAACSTCGRQNLDHEDLGRWMEGEPALVDENGQRWKWIMSVEGGGAAKSKKVLMD